MEGASQDANKTLIPGLPWLARRLRLCLPSRSIHRSIGEAREKDTRTYVRTSNSDAPLCAHVPSTDNQNRQPSTPPPSRSDGKEESHPSAGPQHGSKRRGCHPPPPRQSILSAAIRHCDSKYIRALIEVSRRPTSQLLLHISALQGSTRPGGDGVPSRGGRGAR